MVKLFLNKKISLFYSFLPIILATFVATGIILAWTEPSQAPPGGNVPAPLNTGNIAQEKVAGLLLNTGAFSNGLIVAYGNVGIGTTSPGYKLDVNGTLRLQPGSAPTANKGVMYYDLSTDKFRCYEGTSWTNCTGAGGGTITSISQGDGITLSSDPITTTGTVSLNTTAISGCTTGTSKIIWDSTNKRLNCATDQGGSGTVTSVGGNIGLVADPSPITTSGNIQLNISSISTCTDTTTSKIIWDSSSYKLKCATDQGGTSYWTLNGADLYPASTSYDVGVGTYNPSYDLDVSGDINASGVYRKGGTPGINITGCATNQVLKAPTISGGIITGGSCGNITWSCYTTYYDASKPSGSGYILTGSAICEDGWRTGGGCSCSGGSGETFVKESIPYASGDGGWQCTCQNDDQGTGSISMRVWAVCCYHPNN